MGGLRAQAAPHRWTQHSECIRNACTCGKISAQGKSPCMQRIAKRKEVWETNKRRHRRSAGHTRPHATSQKHLDRMCWRAAAWVHASLICLQQLERHCAHNSDLHTTAGTTIYTHFHPLSAHND
eukprot:533714-Pelagomonas_calceolata.AAC.1